MSRERSACRSGYHHATGSSSSGKRLTTDDARRRRCYYSVIAHQKGEAVPPDDAASLAGRDGRARLRGARNSRHIVRGRGRASCLRWTRRRRRHPEPTTSAPAPRRRRRRPIWASGAHGRASRHGGSSYVVLHAAPRWPEKAGRRNLMWNLRILHTFSFSTSPTSQRKTALLAVAVAVGLRPQVAQLGGRG